MNGIGYIYKITNKINNKIYIGKTKDTIELRFKGHVRDAQKYKDGNFRSHLYEAMNLYGIENFTVQEIESCNYDLLSEREQYWIKYYNSQDGDVGYNICKGGEGGPGGPMMQGKHHSLQTRQWMSDSRKGTQNSNYGNRWNQSDELKQLHSVLSSGENNGMYGKKHTEGTKKLISERNSGKVAYSNVEKDIVKMIAKGEIEKYVSQGWIKGNIHKHKK